MSDQSKDGIFGRLFGRSADVEAETSPESDLQPALPDAEDGAEELHEVVEDTAGEVDDEVGLDPNQIDQLRMEMILEESHQEGQPGVEHADGEHHFGDAVVDDEQLGVEHADGEHHIGDAFVDNGQPDVEHADGEHHFGEEELSLPFPTYEEIVTMIGNDPGGAAYLLYARQLQCQRSEDRLKAAQLQLKQQEELALRQRNLILELQNTVLTKRDDFKRFQDQVDLERQEAQITIDDLHAKMRAATRAQAGERAPAGSSIVEGIAVESNRRQSGMHPSRREIDNSEPMERTNFGDDVFEPDRRPADMRPPGPAARGARSSIGPGRRFSGLHTSTNEGRGAGLLTDDEILQELAKKKTRTVDRQKEDQDLLNVATQLSQMEIELGGGEDSGMIELPTKCWKHEEKHRVLELVKKKLAGKYKSRESLPPFSVVLGDFMELFMDPQIRLIPMAKAFRECDLEAVIEVYREIYFRALEQADNIRDRKTVIRTLRLDDGEVLFLAVQTAFASLHAGLATELSGNLRHESQVADLHGSKGWMALALAKRYLFTQKVSDMPERLKVIVSMGLVFKEVFSSNISTYRTWIQRMIREFEDDFGEINSEVIEHALVLNELVHPSDQALKEFMRKLKVTDQYVNELQNYDQMKRIYSEFVDQASAYIKRNYSDKYYHEPRSTQDVASKVNAALARKGGKVVNSSNESVNHASKAGAAMVQFRVGDDMPACKSCGRNHPTNEGCLTLENWRQVIDSYGPIARDHEALRKELTKILSLLAGDKPLSDKVKSFTMASEKMVKFLTALQTSFVKSRNNFHRRLPKPRGGAPASTGKNAAMVLKLAAPSQEKAKAVPGNSNKARAAVKAISQIIADAKLPPSSCIHWLIEGAGKPGSKTCKRGDACTFEHKPEFAKRLQSQKAHVMQLLTGESQPAPVAKGSAQSAGKGSAKPAARQTRPGAQSQVNLASAASSHNSSTDDVFYNLLGFHIHVTDDDSHAAGLEDEYNLAILASVFYQLPNKRGEIEPSWYDLSLSSGEGFGKTLQIFCKCLNGKTIAVDINENCTVLELKNRVNEKSSFVMPAKIVRMVYAGKQLDDAFTLRQSRISNNATIETCSRLKAGASVIDLGIDSGKQFLAELQKLQVDEDRADFMDFHLQRAEMVNEIVYLVGKDKFSPSRKMVETHVNQEIGPRGDERLGMLEKKVRSLQISGIQAGCRSKPIGYERDEIEEYFTADEARGRLTSAACDTSRFLTQMTESNGFDWKGVSQHPVQELRDFAKQHLTKRGWDLQTGQNELFIIAREVCRNLIQRAFVDTIVELTNHGVITGRQEADWMVSILTILQMQEEAFCKMDYDELFFEQMREEEIIEADEMEGRGYKFNEFGGLKRYGWIILHFYPLLRFNVRLKNLQTRLANMQKLEMMLLLKDCTYLESRYETESIIRQGKAVMLRPLQMCSDMALSSGIFRKHFQTGPIFCQRWVDLADDAIDSLWRGRLDSHGGSIFSLFKEQGEVALNARVCWQIMGSEVTSFIELEALEAASFVYKNFQESTYYDQVKAYGFMLDPIARACTTAGWAERYQVDMGTYKPYAPMVQTGMIECYLARLPRNQIRLGDIGHGAGDECLKRRDSIEILSLPFNDRSGIGNGHCLAGRRSKCKCAIFHQNVNLNEFPEGGGDQYLSGCLSKTKLQNLNMQFRRIVQAQEQFASESYIREKKCLLKYQHAGEMLMHEVKGADAEDLFLQEKENQCFTVVADLGKQNEKHAYALGLRIILGINQLSPSCVTTPVGYEAVGNTDGLALRNGIFLKTLEENRKVSFENALAYVAASAQSPYAGVSDELCYQVHHVATIFKMRKTTYDIFLQSVIAFASAATKRRAWHSHFGDSADLELSDEIPKNTADLFAAAIAVKRAHFNLEENRFEESMVPRISRILSVTDRQIQSNKAAICMVRKRRLHLREKENKAILIFAQQMCYGSATARDVTNILGTLSCNLRGNQQCNCSALQEPYDRAVLQEQYQMAADPSEEGWQRFHVLDIFHKWMWSHKNRGWVEQYYAKRFEANAYHWRMNSINEDPAEDEKSFFQGERRYFEFLRMTDPRCEGTIFGTSHLYYYNMHEPSRDAQLQIIHGIFRPWVEEIRQVGSEDQDYHSLYKLIRRQLNDMPPKVGRQILHELSTRWMGIIDKQTCSYQAYEEVEIEDPDPLGGSTTALNGKISLRSVLSWLHTLICTWEHGFDASGWLITSADLVDANYKYTLTRNDDLRETALALNLEMQFFNVYGTRIREDGTVAYTSESRRKSSYRLMYNKILARTPMVLRWPGSEGFGLPLRFQDLEVKLNAAGMPELTYDTKFVCEERESLPRRQLVLLAEIFAQRGYRFRDRKRNEIEANEEIMQVMFRDWQARVHMMKHVRALAQIAARKIKAKSFRDVSIENAKAREQRKLGPPCYLSHSCKPQSWAGKRPRDDDEDRDGAYRETRYSRENGVTRGDGSTGHHGGSKGAQRERNDKQSSHFCKQVFFVDVLDSGEISFTVPVYKSTHTSGEIPRTRNRTHKARLSWRRRYEGGGADDFLRLSPHWSRFLNRRRRRISNDQKRWRLFATECFQGLLELPDNWENWDAREVQSQYARSLHPAWSLWYSWNQIDQADTRDAHTETSSIEVTQPDLSSGASEEWALWSNEIYHELVTTLDTAAGDFAAVDVALAAAPLTHTVSDEESESATVIHGSDDDSAGSDDSMPGLIGSDTEPEDIHMQDDDNAVHEVDGAEMQERPDLVDVEINVDSSVSVHFSSFSFNTDSDIPDDDMPDLVSEDEESDDGIPGMINTSSSDDTESDDGNDEDDTPGMAPPILPQTMRATTGIYVTQDSSGMGSYDRAPRRTQRFRSRIAKWAVLARQLARNRAIERMMRLKQRLISTSCDNDSKSRYTHPLSPISMTDVASLRDLNESESRVYPAVLQNDNGDGRAFVSRFLASYKAAPARDKVLHLVDSGSTCFLSPVREHFLVPARTAMRISGVGQGLAEKVSPLAISTITSTGSYHLIKYPTVYGLANGGLSFPIMPTGKLELQGYRFALEAEHGHMTTPNGDVIPLLFDASTGFHWFVERLYARPTIEWKIRYFEDWNKHPAKSTVQLADEPCIPSLDMAETPPGKPDTQYEVDRNIVESANWGEHAAPAVTRGAIQAGSNQQLQQRERVTLNERNQVLGTKCLRQKCDFPRRMVGNQILPFCSRSCGKEYVANQDGYENADLDTKCQREQCAFPRIKKDGILLPFCSKKCQEAVEGVIGKINKKKGIYEAERLVSKRDFDGITKWEVKWKNFAHKHNTWEPKENISRELLQEFEDYEAEKEAGVDPRDSMNRNNPASSKGELANTEPPSETQAMDSDHEMSDEKYFRDQKISALKKGGKPIKLKFPAARLIDTGEAKEVQQLKRDLHNLMGHLGNDSIQKAIDHVDGLDVAKAIAAAQAHPGKQHCDSCAENRERMPATPTGKTARLLRKDVIHKLYVDLSGKVEEKSIYHGYHYYIAAVTDYGFAFVEGITFRSQALLALARILADAEGKVRVVQVDGEGNLNSKIAEDYFAGRNIKLITTEAHAHFRNGKIEVRHKLWKGMARAMMSGAGMHIGWWHHAVRHAVLITNLMLLTNSLTDNGSLKSMTVWEKHFGIRPNITDYLIAPFGCLCYLVLSKEQRQQRGLSSHWGVRSIQGLYIGCRVNPKTGVYSHLITDGRSIFASPNAVKPVVDAFPMRWTLNKELPVIPRSDDHLQEESNLAQAVQAWKEANEQKADETRLKRDFLHETSMALETKYKGEDRKKGLNKKTPFRVVSEDGGGDPDKTDVFAPCNEKSIEIALENPADHVINPSPSDLIFTEPYEGAKYQLAVPIDFSDAERVPKETKHPHQRFVGRKVRKIFSTPTGQALRMKNQSIEGVVKAYQEQRQLFKISYVDGDRDEVDFAELMDILIMDPKYGDKVGDKGKTRRERDERAKSEALMISWLEEVMFNRPFLSSTESSESEREGGRMRIMGLCHLLEESYAAQGAPDLDTSREPIYDDEPRNQKELDAHPEKEKILEAAAKEMQALVEMDIGVQLTEQQAHEVVKSGAKILRSKMVYKRKYGISEADGKEYFLKWKGRLAIVGTGETEGVDTVYNTFSPTVGFTAIRTLMSLLCDPKFHVGSYDLSSAFVATELEDRAVYVRLPADAGSSANKIIRLTKNVYGMKNSGKAFVQKLGKEILAFEESFIDGNGREEKARFHRLPSDQCIFRYIDSKGREMILLHYVDDIVCATTHPDLRERLFKHLNKTWKITDEGVLNRFLGVHFERSADGWEWKATMATYIDRIVERFGLKDARRADTPMEAGFVLTEEDFLEEPTPEMIHEMRSLIGSIGYCATAVRFDVSYAVSVLSRHLVKPCKKVIDAAKRVIRYLDATKDFSIKWWASDRDVGEGMNNTLFGATDASYAMDPISRKSHGGYINFINHGAVSWKSGLQPIVTLSSCEAEYVALCAAVCEVKYIRSLMRDLGYAQKDATIVWEDNKAAILIAENECSSAGRSKHIDVKFKFVAQAIADGVVRVRYISTNLNFADLFTKPLVREVFNRLVKLCTEDKHEHFRSIEVAIEGEEVRVSTDSDVLDEGNDYWVAMDVPESMLESVWA